ncbi:MAG: LD-carboxypeptidase [Candidatus Marinimicrobia bacterium]|nr:LD-carboxypeptidase [Candidatus Neomarinimicrobiota bacterium]
MIKPLRLKPGGTIGIVNPSYWLKEEFLIKTVKIMEARGYKIQLGKSTKLKDNLFAGTPEERAEDLMNMFMNPEIDAIVCARGGYGANRVEPLLDYDIIKANPKIFMGYSDITAYSTSITQKTGLVTFQGPMLVTHKDEELEYNFINFEKGVVQAAPYLIEPPNDFPSRILKTGTAEGPLWGGNISLLVNRLATANQLDTDGAILFLEDIDEYLYSFDRTMYHLRQTGMFDKINGLIIGEMYEMKDTETPFGKTIDEIVMDVCGDLDIPIISNFACGHGRYQATMPISIPSRLQADSAIPTLEILESPVK